MGIDTLCLQPALGSSQFPKASLRRSSSQRRHCTTELEPNLLQSVCSTWTSAFRQERLAESLHAVFPYAAPKVSFKIPPESLFANRSTNQPWPGAAANPRTKGPRNIEKSEKVTRGTVATCSPKLSSHLFGSQKKRAAPVHQPARRSREVG